MFEELQIGDPILTADGRTTDVKWVVRQTVHKLFSREQACPVRFSAGALGEGLPSRDLVPAGDLALMFEGLAINASALVNGMTITFDPFSSLLPDALRERLGIPNAIEFDIALSYTR